MKSIHRPALALTALALALPSAAAAGTITISSDADAVAKFNSAADGDTIHFKAGTYRSTFSTSKNNLTIEGEPGAFLTGPASGSTTTLELTGSNTKITDLVIGSSVADAVTLGKDATTIQRASLVSFATGRSAVAVTGGAGDAARAITVDSTLLIGANAFSATAGVGSGAMAAALRHVTAIGKVIANASMATLGGDITVTALDSIIRGARTPTGTTVPGIAAGTITADPARNSVADTSADAAKLFVSPGAFNYHLRADAAGVLDKGQVTSGESDKDIDGDPRVVGSASDYGADEFLNKAPTAWLAAPVGKVRQGIPATFDASKSSDPEALSGGGIANYHWDFGDGSTVDTATPTTTHTFAERKTYSVTVTVTDKQGGVSTAATPLSVTVVDGTAPTITISQPAVKQRLTLYRKSGKRSRITFFGKATDDTLLDRVVLALRTVALKGKQCRWFDTKSKLVTGDCKNPPVAVARVTGTRWRYKLPAKARLPRGPYVLVAIAVDGAGNFSEFKSSTFRFR